MTTLSVLTAEKQFSVQARQSRQLAKASLVSGPISVRSSTMLRYRATLPRATLASRPVARKMGQAGWQKPHLPQVTTWS